MVEGLLLVKKPAGVTSHDVVQILRRKLGLRRIGHAGTLDPMAEGLLVLLVGEATRHQQALQGHEKVYEATIRLGLKTNTGDAMGTPLGTAAVPLLERALISEALASFVGPLSQTPPAFSAVKVHGRPAYWWARRQQSVTLSQRTVQVFELSLLDHGPDSLAIRVHCSAGTYVRTLAESIAERLGTVGHLTGLVRTRIGAWSLEQARPLSWFLEASAGAIIQQLVPIRR